MSREIRYWVCVGGTSLDIILALMGPRATREIFILSAVAFALGAVLSVTKE